MSPPARPRPNGSKNGAPDAAPPPPAPRAPDAAVPARDDAAASARAHAMDPGESPAPDATASEPTARLDAGPAVLPPTGNPVLDGPWLQIVGQLKTSQPALAAVLDHGSPLEVTPTSLRIAFPEGSFFGRQAQSPSAREGILRAAELALGARPELSIVRSSERSAPTLAAAEEESRRVRVEGRREAALRHPRVQEALEVFGESEQSVDIYVEE